MGFIERYEEEMDKEIEKALPFIESIRKGEFTFLNTEEDEDNFDEIEFDDHEHVKVNNFHLYLYNGEQKRNKLRLNARSADDKVKVYYNNLDGHCQNIIFNEETKELIAFTVYEGEGACRYWEDKNIFVFDGHEEIILVSADAGLKTFRMFTR